MKRLIVSLFVLTAISFAQTDVSGTISGNTTWNVSGSPYTIKGTQNCTQTLDLCMLNDRLPSTNEQICGRRIMAITRASQACKPLF